MKRFTSSDSNNELSASPTFNNSLSPSTNRRKARLMRISSQELNELKIANASRVSNFNKK